MTGVLCLQGGAEFRERCRDMDTALLERAGGRVVVAPLAAGRGRQYDATGAEAVDYFTGLGAHDVVVAPDARADEGAAVAAVAGARLLFLPGGSPGRLLTTLLQPSLREALLAVVRRGAVVAGASAGAMVLAEHVVLPEGGSPRVVAGLGLVPGVVVLPHYGGDDRWWRLVAREHPTVTGLGLPECSGVVVDGSRWLPVGAESPTLLTTRGSVTLETALPAPVTGDTAPEGRGGRGEESR